jgi:hypothetical protein
MNSYASARRNRLPLAFALLFAVFMWGFHYKVSLYHSKDHSRPSMSPVKLLSEAEKPLSAQAAISFTLNTRLTVAVLFVASSVHHAGLVSNEGYAELESPQASPPALRAWRRFLPRPPPHA